LEELTTKYGLGLKYTPSHTFFNYTFRPKPFAANKTQANLGYSAILTRFSVFQQNQSFLYLNYSFQND